MAANGILEFQGTEKAIFRGSNSNIVIDTANSSFGVGVDTPTSNLHIVGKTSLQGDLNLVQVSNVANVTVNSNVVAEYTGPHDRPLRKYPEVALTSASQGGYVVTASSDQSQYSLNAWRIFDGVKSAGTGWASQDGTYYDGTSPANSYTGTVHQLGTGTAYGEWLKLELPKKIRVSKFILYADPGVSYGTDEAPKSYKIYGSVTGSSWTELKDVSNETPSTNGNSHIITDTTAYRYVGIVVTQVNTDQDNIRIGELEYYGYEEGDASLDTTLKSVYNVPATTGTQLEVYYDAKDLTEMPSTVTDLSPNSNGGSVTGVTLDETGGINSFKFNGSSQYVTGTHGLTTGSDPVHTISLWFKRTAKVNQFDYLVQLGEGGTSHQQSAIFIDDDKIGHGHWGGGVYQTDVITDNVWYHVAATFTGGNTSDLSTHKIYVNGVEKGINAYSSDGPLVLTGTALTLGRNENALGSPGGYFNGSIANFRLYYKALNADQVKELYDYQKDYFLGSKSQLTIYKGHLGVGVTEPSGQLELAGDERIQEYPPRGMTNPSTYIEGHGVFKAYGFQPHSSYPAWNAFDHTGNLSSVWYSDTLSEFTGTGEYNGSTRLAPETLKGPYVVLEMPYEIVLKQIKFWQQFGGSHVWDRGVYYAKCNPSDEWTAIHNVTDRPADDDTPYVAYITDPRPYKYFAIVITRRHTAHTTNGVSIRDLQFFGTPGPTTLDKGSLSLTRSLDVPRVSRYDVDTETPRPEKLVVDFDTTVNSSPTDISGQGNHGTFVNGASYSPADKAFTFDGSPSNPQRSANSTISAEPGGPWSSATRPSGSGKSLKLSWTCGGT
jgi:hypothetical protein